MSNVTVFENFTTPAANKPLFAIAEEIRGGKYRGRVEEIRLLVSKGEIEEAQKKKQLLPAFTPSATFKNRRTLEHLDQYSGFIHLDFDHILPEKMDAMFQSVSIIPYTYLCFRSPSGNGIKVFVEVSAGAEKHLQAYMEVARIYELITGMHADYKCKDITRLCFMSYDPRLFINSKPLKYAAGEKTPFPDINRIFENDKPAPPPIVTPEPVKQDVTPVPDKDWNAEYELCRQNTDSVKVYAAGSRNEYVYSLACQCNRDGIPENIALQYAARDYDLPAQEIRTAFHSAYTHHTGEFASLQYCKTAKLQNGEEDSIDYLKNSPLLPESIYDNLPAILKEGAKAFEQPRERDVYLTGALSILSGCLPRVKGVYDGVDILPHLFTFAIAPAASGKGALKFAKMLADEYHQYTVNTSVEAAFKYRTDLSRYKNADNGGEPPEEPKFKVVFIPADTSCSKILLHLKNNGGTGIICETESDTLGNIFKKEWGSYSDLLRKAFHNEKVSSSRKTNNEFMEVDNPGISVALSGTPNQVTSLISSAEDGLFSRFIFYVFKVDQAWKDVSPKAHPFNLNEHFRTLSERVFDMVNFLEKHDTVVDLSPEQWDKLNEQCGKWLLEVTMFTGDEAASVVKRLGLIIYRIAILFTAMRKAEWLENSTHITCTDTDFNTALELGKAYLEHSLLMFNTLPKHTDAANLAQTDKKKLLFNELPHEFTRSMAVEKAKQLGLSTRTTDAFLHHATGKLINKVKQGGYEKK